MEFEMKPYIVYIKRNEYCEIIAVNSSAFLKDTTGWDEFDSGYGDRFHHAQGNYFQKPLMNYNGVYRYVAIEEEIQYEDGEYAMGWTIEERTDKEMVELYEAPTPVPSQLDIIEAQVTYTAMMTDTLLEG